jgi:hypothetical protein
VKLVAIPPQNRGLDSGGSRPSAIAFLALSSNIRLGMSLPEGIAACIFSSFAQCCADEGAPSRFVPQGP